MNTSTQSPDIDTIKAKHKATWEDGNYAGFASYMQDGAIEVLDSWRIAPGTNLLSEPFQLDRKLTGRRRWWPGWDGARDVRPC